MMELEELAASLSLWKQTVQDEKKGPVDTAGEKYTDTDPISFKSCIMFLQNVQLFDQTDVIKTYWRFWN